MKYSEIKKRLQDLHKKAHAAAKELPSNYDTVIEIAERTEERGAFYSYRLSVYHEEEFGSKIWVRGNIYPFWTDEQNIEALDKALNEFLAEVETLKNTKQ